MRLIELPEQMASLEAFVLWILTFLGSLVEGIVLGLVQGTL